MKSFYTNVFKTTRMTVGKVKNGQGGREGEEEEQERGNNRSHWTLSHRRMKKKKKFFFQLNKCFPLKMHTPTTTLHIYKCRLNFLKRFSFFFPFPLSLKNLKAFFSLSHLSFISPSLNITILLIFSHVKKKYFNGYLRRIYITNCRKLRIFFLFTLV